MSTRMIDVFVATAVLAVALSEAQAEDKPDAMLKLSGGSVAAGIGYTWGGGTLRYRAGLTRSSCQVSLSPTWALPR
jgi:hypothetical protein